MSSPKHCTADRRSTGRWLGPGPSPTPEATRAGSSPRSRPRHCDRGLLFGGYGGTWQKLFVEPKTGIVLATERVERREGQTLVQKAVFYEAGWTDTPPS